MKPKTGPTHLSPRSQQIDSHTFYHIIRALKKLKNKWTKTKQKKVPRKNQINKNWRTTNNSPFREARRQLRKKGSAWRRSESRRVSSTHTSAGGTAEGSSLISGPILPAVECRTTGDITRERSRCETVGARSWSCWSRGTRRCSCSWCSTYGSPRTKFKRWKNILTIQKMNLVGNSQLFFSFWTTKKVSSYSFLLASKYDKKFD